MFGETEKENKKHKAYKSDVMIISATKLRYCITIYEMNVKLTTFSIEE